MIYLTPDDTQKFKLIDQFVRAIPTTELNALVEADLVANRLRNADTAISGTSGPIQTILESHNKLESDVMALRSEVSMLTNDIRSIVKAMSKPFDSYAINDFNTIKSKYGAY